MIRSLGPTRAAVLLVARANPTGADSYADSYMEYEEEGVVVPAGTIAAKESFNVTDKSKSPKTGDW
ncbi:MAG: hypothetical protein RIC87_18685 [Kiloniellales bacterium]